MEKTTLKVEGMSCKHCVAAVTKAVGAFAGTAKVKTDLKTGTVTFDHDPEKTKLTEIKAAIAEAGFSVSA